MPVSLLTFLQSVKEVIYNERKHSFNGAHVYCPSRGPLLLNDFIYLLILIKEPWVAAQGMWRWGRVLEIKNNCESLTWGQPWGCETASSLFKLKRDTTEKPSYDPSGLGLETQSSITLGTHIFKERRTVVRKAWMNHYTLASFSRGIYLQIETWHCRFSGFLNGACGQMEKQGHSIIRLHV